MGCAGSAANKYDVPKEAFGDQAEEASYPSGEWRVEESPEQWIALEQEIGQQLLQAYFNGQTEASYALHGNSFHVDFYQQLQTHQESGRQCRIAWFDTSAALAAAGSGDGAGDGAEELNGNPEVYLGGEWLIEDEGSWVRLDHEISAQLLVAWYCGEQVLDYSFQGASFQVDLTVWEQRNLETGQRKKIVWNSSDASSEGDTGLADSAEGGVHWDWKYNSISYIPNQQIGAWGSPQCISLKTTIWDKIRPDPWLDPGEEAERQLWAALNSGQQVVRYNVNGCQYEVDVVNMIQTNLSTGERWMIAVEEGPGAEVPDKATETASNPLEATQVPEPSPESTAFAGGASEPRAVPTAKGGRPKAFIYKSVPEPGRPPPKQKKWSLAPGQKARLAPKAAPKPRSAPKPGGGAKELPLPRNVEWPKGAKARRVAEAVYADMRKSREKPLAHRRRAYMAACLSWHPDKNLKHQEVATEVFQFLQAVKDWYFEEGGLA